MGNKKERNTMKRDIRKIARKREEHRKMKKRMNLKGRKSMNRERTKKDGSE